MVNARKGETEKRVRKWTWKRVSEVWESDVRQVFGYEKGF